jgi:chemotaxis signal transduction protein
MSVGAVKNANDTGNRGLTVRFRAGGKHFAFSLKAIESIAGYAKLQEFTENAAPPDHTSFAGWLEYRGTQVPVFDLGLFLGNSETPLLLSSRIMLFTRLGDSGRADAAKQRVGLLAADITDTRQESELEGAELLQPEPLLRELLGENA